MVSTAPLASVFTVDDEDVIVPMSVVVVVTLSIPIWSPVAVFPDP